MRMLRLWPKKLFLAALPSRATPVHNKQILLAPKSPDCVWPVPPLRASRPKSFLSVFPVIFSSCATLMRSVCRTGWCSYQSHAVTSPFPLSIFIVPLCATPSPCAGRLQGTCLPAMAITQVNRSTTVSLASHLLMPVVRRCSAGAQYFFPFWPDRECGRSVCHLRSLWPHR